MLLYMNATIFLQTSFRFDFNNTLSQQLYPFEIPGTNISQFNQYCFEVLNKHT